MRTDVNDRLDRALHSIDEGHFPGEDEYEPEEDAEEALTIGEAVVTMLLDAPNGEETAADILRSIVEWVKDTDHRDTLIKGLQVMEHLSNGLGELKSITEEKAGVELITNNPSLVDPPQGFEDEEELAESDPGDNEE
jgi:hypothetical protein